MHHNAIMECFPFFRAHPEIIYLDAAATTFMPDSVLHVWQDYHHRIGIASGRSRSYIGAQAAEALRAARATIKSFFGADESYTLIFVKNATEALNMAAWGLQNSLNSGDLIILTALEHHSNLLPWQRLAQKRSASVLELPLAPNGLPDMAMLEHFRGQRGRLFCITHTSNVTGVQPDVNTFSAFAHQEDGLVVVDATQAAGHTRVNLAKLKADCLAVSAHKMYGPKNIGGLFLRKNLLPFFEPFLLGGGMVWEAGAKPVWLDGPDKLEGGTFDPGLASAWAESCLFLQSIGLDEITHSEKKLTNRLRKGLESLGNTTVYGCESHASPSITSCGFSDVHPHDMESWLSSRNIIIRSGHLCAQSAMRHLGVTGVNRISIGLGVNSTYIDHFLNAVSDYRNKVRIFSFSNSQATNNFFAYPHFIYELVAQKITRLQIAPDTVIISDGIACGDSFILEMTFDSSACFFTCHVQGCLPCQASAAFMELLNGLSLAQVRQAASAFLALLEHGTLPTEHKFPLPLESWMAWQLPQDRIACVTAPWRLLLRATPSCTCDAEPLSVPLACDACVQAHRIHWTVVPRQAAPARAAQSLVQFCRNLSRLDRESDLQWQPLAKELLSENEKKN